MTLEDAIKWQDGQLVDAQNGIDQPLDGGTHLMQFDIEQKEWLSTTFTLLFLQSLERESARLDAQAKDLAALDEDFGKSKIRALLIESKTLDKVLSYAKRNTRDTEFNATP